MLTAARKNQVNETAAQTVVGACHCPGCGSVWEYEERDLIGGQDLFCPVCTSRVIEPELFKTLTAAQNKHPQAKPYAD